MLPITSPPIRWPDPTGRVRTGSMTERPLSAVVLAAGEGTRMRSTRPKPLHLLCGRAMLLYVLDALGELRDPPGRRRGRPRRRAGHQEAAGGRPRPASSSSSSSTCSAAPATPSASASPAFPDDDLDDDDGDVLVLPGDTPLLRPRTIAALVAAHRADRRRLHRPHRPAAPTPPATAGSCGARTTGSRRIVEQADATAEELAIDEINTSIYCFRRSLLAPALRRLSPENAQGEYYLTDVVEVLADAGLPGRGGRRRRPRRDPGRQRPGPAGRGRGRAAPPHQRRAGCAQGVTMLDPARTYIDTTVAAGRRRHPVPRHDPPGPHRHRRRRRDRARTPAWSTASVGAGAAVEQTVGRDAEIGDGRRGRARSPCSSRARRSRPAPAPGRSTLRAPTAAHGARGRGRSGAGIRMELVTKKRLHLVSGPGQPAAGRGDRRPPRRHARRRQPAPSSPTARSTAASASRSAAPTSSSSRPTAPPTSMSVNDAHHGAADHGRRRQAGLGQAHHRRSCPFYGYARQDRKAEGREPITAKLVANMFTAAGRQAAHRRSTCTPARSRASSTARSTTSPPCRCSSTTWPSLRRRPGRRVARRRPGEGGRALRQRSSTPTSPSCTSAGSRAQKNTVEARDVVGEVDGRTCVLIDDMIDTGGTIVRRRRAAHRARRHRGLRAWPPTACSPARPSTASRTR